MSVLLGISAYYHDSAAALIQDGIVICAAQEERFTRKKNDASFPISAVRFCLDEAGITETDLDGVVFYDKPITKFGRPSRVISCGSAMWIIYLSACYPFMAGREVRSTIHYSSRMEDFTQRGAYIFCSASSIPCGQRAFILRLLMRQPY